MGDAHPDFAGRPPPRNAAIGGFLLEILTPKDAGEDFEVVTQSEAVLQGLFGDDWPRGLTPAENLEDLVRHEREFANDQAFAWIIRAEDGRYLGCAYLVPRPGERGKGKVYTWIRDRKDRLELLAEFNAAFADWLAPHLPPGFDITWITNDQPAATLS